MSSIYSYVLILTKWPTKIAINQVSCEHYTSAINNAIGIKLGCMFKAKQHLYSVCVRLDNGEVDCVFVFDHVSCLCLLM